MNIAPTIKKRDRGRRDLCTVFGTVRFVSAVDLVTGEVSRSGPTTLLPPTRITGEIAGERRTPVLLQPFPAARVRLLRGAPSFSCDLNGRPVHRYACVAASSGQRSRCVRRSTICGISAGRSFSFGFIASIHGVGALDRAQFHTQWPSTSAPPHNQRARRRLASVAPPGRRPR